MKFKMRIDSAHSPLTVDLENTATGWTVNGVTANECNLAATPSGKGGLLQILSNHAIAYPAALHVCLERFWSQLAAGSESSDHIREQLQLLGDWIAVCDKGASPRLER